MGEAVESLPAVRVGPGFPPANRRFGQPNGNPIGRTPGGHVAILMAKVRKYWQDGDKIIPVLEEALKAPRWADRLMAVQIILERGWGKAPNMLDSEDHGPLALTDEELSIVTGIYGKALQRGIGAVDGVGSPSTEPIQSAVVHPPRPDPEASGIPKPPV